jgi:hypothetical protein
MRTGIHPVNPTLHPTYQADTIGRIRHHRTKDPAILGRILRQGTSPTDCLHLIIPGSWVRSPPALLSDVRLRHVVAEAVPEYPLHF